MCSTKSGNDRGPSVLRTAKRAWGPKRSIRWREVRGFASHVLAVYLRRRMVQLEHGLRMHPAPPAIEPTLEARTPGHALRSGTTGSHRVCPCLHPAHRNLPRTLRLQRASVSGPPPAVRQQQVRPAAPATAATRGGVKWSDLYPAAWLEYGGFSSSADNRHTPRLADRRQPRKPAPRAHRPDAHHD
jgi:hypothetical protein